MTASTDLELIRNHEVRLQSLEGQMADLRVTLTRVEGDMKLNNVMTAEIKTTLHNMQQNTADIVDLGKGLRVIGRVAVWGGGVTTAIIGVLAVIKLLGG
jgi:hypothetical protein